MPIKLQYITLPFQLNTFHRIRFAVKTLLEAEQHLLSHYFFDEGLSKWFNVQVIYLYNTNMWFLHLSYVIRVLYEM